MELANDSSALYLVVLLAHAVVDDVDPSKNVYRIPLNVETVIYILFNDIYSNFSSTNFTEGMHNPCLYQHKIITQMGNFNEGVHNPFLLSKYQHK